MTGYSQIWDMSQERQFMEKLLCNRFNFFIIFYSIVIGGSITAKNPSYVAVILTIGAIVCYLLSLTLSRVQRKLDLIFNWLKKNCEDHPYVLIDNLAGAEGSRRKLIGYTIPQFCTSTLIVGASLAAFRVLYFYSSHLRN